MEFREQLPASCPPQAPRTPTLGHLWRLVPSAVPTEKHFDSQHKKQPTRQFKDACGARAISLLVDLETCRAVSKAPYMKGMTHAVKIKCCTTLGVWDQDKPEHVNWWPYSSVDVLAQASDVEDLL